MFDQDTLQAIVEDSFKAEVKAFKPGNVSVYSAGHDMHVDDFLLSAELSSPILVNTELTIGERIYQAVKITLDTVGCNTNLGMLLLFTPLIIAAQQKSFKLDSLSKELLNIIKNIDATDTDRIFRAIQYAKPGGLGTSEEYDVNKKNKLEQELSVFAAMEFASSWDRIAMQYTTGYDDILNIGLPTIKHFVQSWNSVEYALVACYVKFLSAFPDSHIQRKYGLEVAKEIQEHGMSIATDFLALQEPTSFNKALEKFDRQLKRRKINPGTCADLTACSYLLFQLNKHLNI